MAHAHGHNHSHGPSSFGRAFAIAIGLNLTFVVVEFGAGLLAGSLALMADAGHNLSDVLGLVVAWGGSLLAARRPTAQRTYGLRRSSILAALLNAVFLLIALGGIAWEAIRRLQAPEPTAGWTVIGVALVGIVINAATALLFMRGREHDLNIRGAFLHMAADAGVSVGVVLAGALILVTGWLWVDPLISLAIAGVILLGTWGLLRDSVNMALDAVPAGMDVATVQTYLAALPGVINVHDLHIWPMSTTETSLTAHLICRPGAGNTDALLQQAAAELHDRFGIEHVTLQLEMGDPTHPCAACSLLPDSSSLRTTIQ
jgi:cobalt-zinc-cadmium efflux system protein